jgi:hypothetical protein
MFARIHFESINPNGKIFKGKLLTYIRTNFYFYVESAVQEKLFIDINRLRDRPKFVQDRVPMDRID